MRKTVTLGTFVLFIFVFNAFISVAQSKRDSLLMLLNKGVRDTSKVILYGELGHYYLTSDLDSSLFYTTTGLRLAEELKYNYGIGKMYHVLGHAMVVNDSLGKARMYYLKANEYFKKAKNLPSQSSVYLVMGNIFLVQNNLPEALDCYIKGQKITDSLNLVGLLPHFYNNLGGVYSLLEDFQLALENFNKALIINEKNGDTETAISILTNMSDIYLKIQDYDQAKQLNRRALQLVQEFPENEVYTISIYRALGGIEYELGNHREALELFKNALEKLDQLGLGYLGPRSVDNADIRTKIGNCYYRLGYFDLAKKELSLGFDIAKEAGLLGVQKEAAYYLSKVNDTFGDLRTALDYYIIFNSLSDSISNDNTTRKITQLKLQYEFDKKLKQQEIIRIRTEAEQKRKVLILFISIGSVFLAMIIFILLFLLQKNKTKRIHLERKNLELDLDSKNKELTTNVMYLLKKNEFIESISDKLNKTRLLFKPENRSFIDNIIRELESSISKDAWEEFEVRFQQVHSDFYKKLIEGYPDLSPNDLKLCAFLRLNMSTKEISAITYQSQNTLSTARYRLRKKLGLDDHANLIAFLNQL